MTEKNIDAQLDEIFDKVDDLFIAGKFNEIDDILNNINVDDYPYAILVGYLCITLPLSDQFHIKDTGHHSKARERFYQRVYNRVEREEPDRVNMLLGGLKNFQSVWRT